MKGVGRLKAFEIFWVDEIPMKKVTLVEPTNVNKYSWLDSKTLGTFYISSDPAIVIAVSNKVCLHSNLFVLPINQEKGHVVVWRSVSFLSMNVCSPR